MAKTAKNPQNLNGRGDTHQGIFIDFWHFRDLILAPPVCPGLAEVELSSAYKVLGLGLNKHFPYLIRQVFGKRPHPLASICNKHLFDWTEVNSEPSNILVVLQRENLIPGSL